MLFRSLVYGRYGLDLLLDLGAWWREHTDGLPLPLGCIVIRRALGAGLREAVEECIRSGILFAREHPQAVRPLVAALARELDAATLDQHIAAYVNDFSLDMDTSGKAALDTLQTFRNRP